MINNFNTIGVQKQAALLFFEVFSMAGNLIYSLILHGDSIYLINLRAPFLWFYFVRYR